jgi:hypothetical protein
MGTAVSPQLDESGQLLVMDRGCCHSEPIAPLSIDTLRSADYDIENGSERRNGKTNPRL